MFKNKCKSKNLVSAAVICIMLCLLGAVPGMAKTIDIEFLRAKIDPQSVPQLSGLACRNYDRLVRDSVFKGAQISEIFK